MGVKYKIPYKDSFNQQCRVDILHAPFNGEPTELRGVAEKACIINHDSGDDPLAVLINSRASISVYQTEDEPIDITQLQLAMDREFEVEFYIGGALKWKGFLVPDGIQQEFQSTPFELNLEAIDGLSLLDEIPYTHNNLTGGRCIINYLRQILFANVNLRQPLPIEWVVDVTNDQFYFQDDVFSGSVEWAPFGEGFTDYNGNYKTCGYILQGMLQAFQCRIMQSDGKWKIWRNPDVATGVFGGYTTPATLEGLTITEVPSISHIKMIGGPNTPAYRPIEEKAILRVLPALKSVETTYKQDQRDNVLPNGSMDLVNTFANSPFFWILQNNLTASATMESVDSLYNDIGKAVQVNGPSSGFVYLAMQNQLPIDSDVLYAYINFGFKFLPISGFAVDGSGVINWASKPLTVSVEFFDNNGDLWYLNEFGFWVKTNAIIEIDYTVEGLSQGEVAQLDFNNFQNIILPIPATVPIGRTNPPSLKVYMKVKAGQVVAFDDIYFNVANNSDVYRATNTGSTNTKTERYELEISSAHSGFYVSSFMTDYGNAGDQKFFSDSKALGVTLTELTSIVAMLKRYIPSLLFSCGIYGATREYAEIYTIFNLTGRNFLPLTSTWNTETNVTDIDLVEIRDDSTGLEVLHFGTEGNKAFLSN